MFLETPFSHEILLETYFVQEMSLDKHILHKKCS
jgi:hypothetical protein